MSRIKFNNKVYDTFVDESGTLRFVPNNLILQLSANDKFKASDVLSLYPHYITLTDVLDFYAGIGFIVEMVKELSFFENQIFEEISDE